MRTLPLPRTLLLVAASSALVLTACSETGPRAITIEMRHSRFTPASFTAEPGEQVRITLVNHDLLAHEFIIGTDAEHAAHEQGIEATHDGAPGAASLKAGERQTITYTFARAGELRFACHLPGHYAYGMKGTITVA